MTEQKEASQEVFEAQRGAINFVIDKLKAVLK